MIETGIVSHKRRNLQKKLFRNFYCTRKFLDRYRDSKILDAKFLFYFLPMNILKHFVQIFKIEFWFHFRISNFSFTTWKLNIDVSFFESVTAISSFLSYASFFNLKTLVNDAQSKIETKLSR